MPGQMRSYVANRFLLELQKQTAGWLLTSEGMASTEVVQERLAAGYPCASTPAT